MVTENIDIVIRSRGARVTAKGIDRIGQRAAVATRNLFLLQRALFVIGAGTILRGIQTLSDTFTDMQNRLKLVTEGSANLAAVTEELFSVANRTRTAFEATATIYSRTALSVQQLGISQKETLRFTESLSKAIILSGAGAQEATAAMIQLGQGLASNRLSGDELRSVLEQLPFVADVIAKSLKITRGELRAFGKEGKITALTVLKAFREAREEIAEKFAKTIPTISQSFTILRNRIIQSIGAFNQSTGAATAFASAIILLSTHFDSLFNIIAVGILLFAALQFGKLVAGMSNFSVATFKNTQAQLANNAAKVQSIKAITGERFAREASIATHVAEIQADRASIQSTLALNVAREQEISVRLRSAVITAAETGNKRNLILQQNLLRVSTIGLADTRALLIANTASLTIAERALTVATFATASANTKLAAANVSITLTSRVATAAMATLSRVMAFFGGPIGLAITAIVVTLGFLATRTSVVDRVTENLKQKVSALAKAYEEVEETSGRALANAANLTLVELITDQAKAVNDFEEGLDKLVVSFDRLLQQQERAASLGQLSDERLTALRAFRAALDDLTKTGDVESFVAALNSIGLSGNEALIKFANTVIKDSKEVGKLADNVKTLDALIAVLNGTATEAQINFIRFGTSVIKTVDAMKEIEKAARTGINAFITLSKFSIVDKEQAETLADTIAATKAYRDALDSLAISHKLGDINIEDYNKRQSQLRALFDRAIGSITGNQKAIDKAAAALKDYSLANRLAAQSDRDRAITEATIEYQELIEILNKVEDNQAEVNIATDLYAEALERIKDRFDAIDEETVKKLGDATTFRNLADALSLQVTQLGNLAKGRGDLNVITEIATKLERGLTDAEISEVQASLKAIEAGKIQLKLFKDLQDPIKTVETEIDLLTLLYESGAIKIGAFTRQLAILRAELINVGNAASQSFQDMKTLTDAIPGLRAAAAQQSKLNDIQAAFGRQLEIINQEEAARGVTRITLQKRQELIALTKSATEETLGFAAANRESAEASIAFQKTGDLSGLDAQAKSLKLLREETAALIIERQNAGAGETELAAIRASSAAQEEAINAQAAKRAAKAAAKEDKKFTAEKAIAALEDEQAALLNVIAGREEYNALIAIQSRLEDELSPDQEARILALVRQNEEYASLANTLDDVSGAGPDIIQTFTNLNTLLHAGAISAKEFALAMQDNTFAWLEFQESIGEGSFADGILLGLEDLAFGVADFTSEAGRLMGDFTNNMAEGFSKAISGMILGTTTLRDALFQVAQQALGALIQGLVKLGIQYVLNAVLGQSIAAAATAAQVAQATIIATAYAPAAAAVSLASFGANAVAADIGMTTTAALAKTLFGGAAGAVPGFEHGGSILVGGSGGVDSQLVQLRATPNERIDILTPGQQQARDRALREEDNRDMSRTQINSIEINYQARGGEDRARSANELAKEITEQLSAVTDRDGV